MFFIHQTAMILILRPKKKHNFQSIKWVFKHKVRLNQNFTLHFRLKIYICNHKNKSNYEENLSIPFFV
jgi:hypothetical protein